MIPSLMYHHYCYYYINLYTFLLHFLLSSLHFPSLGISSSYSEASEPFQERKITYNELRAQVCKLANVYKSKGIKKGDRVACYMPMTVELVIAMLACARIGAIHSVIVSIAQRYFHIQNQ